MAEFNKEIRENSNLYIGDKSIHSFPDWNLIDEISIPLLEEGVGTYEILQKALPSIVFARLDKTDTECTEQRLLKLFKIAQMQIHYILLTQQGLVEKLHAEKSKSKKFHKENSTFRKSMSSKPKSDSSRELFQCNECSKIFLHSSFLCDHIQRKHRGVLGGGNLSVLDDSTSDWHLNNNEGHGTLHTKKESNNNLRPPQSPKSFTSSHSGTSVWN